MAVSYSQQTLVLLLQLRTVSSLAKEVMDTCFSTIYFLSNMISMKIVVHLISSCYVQ